MSQAVALALTGASSPSLDTSISLHAVISFAAAYQQQLSSNIHGIRGCLSNGLCITMVLLGVTGAGQRSGASAGGALPNATLHEILEAAVPNAAQPTIQPARKAGLMDIYPATLPRHAAEPFTSFPRLDSRPIAPRDGESEAVTKHVSGGSCKGITVPEQQSEPAEKAPQQKVGGAARSQVSSQPNGTAHPATAHTAQQQGRPQGCRPNTRSAVGSASALLAASQTRTSRHTAALLAQ